MAVNESMAHVSNVLFATAIASYSVAAISYAAEYAFGGRGKVAATAEAQNAPIRVTSAQPRVLVAAGGAPTDTTASAGGPPAEPKVVVRDPGSATPRASRAEWAGRIAVAITVLGALIHLTSVVIRGVAVDRVPWGNMYEFSALAGLIGVLAWLVVLNRMPALRYLGLFVMVPVIILMFLAGTVLYAQAAPLVPALQSYWLAIHVSAAASGEGMLMTSSVLAILYLIKMRYDKQTAAGKSVRWPISMGDRLPSPAQLDKSSYRIVAFAFPIYTFGVICGAIWAEAAWGRYWGWDPKETWAFIAWVIYAAYLHARATAGWKGRGAAWINVAGFAAMTFNFFVVNIVVSGLHSYAGLN